MLLLFGSKDAYDFAGMVAARCPSCGNAPCQLFLARTKFTLYMIPTFTMSSRYLVRCPHCQRRWEVDRETGERLQASARQPTSAPTAPPPPTAPPKPGPTAGGRPTLIGTPCPGCGQTLAPGARFCHQCGASIGGASRRVTCPSCGHEQEPAPFCGRCGARLPGTASS